MYASKRPIDPYIHFISSKPHHLPAEKNHYLFSVKMWMYMKMIKSNVHYFIKLANRLCIVINAKLVLLKRIANIQYTLGRLVKLHLKIKVSRQNIYFYFFCVTQSHIFWHIFVYSGSYFENLNEVLIYRFKQFEIY